MGAENSPGTLTFVGVGDVGPIVQPVDRLVDLALPALQSADFRIAQCERTYSTRGAYPRWLASPGGVHTRQDPALATIFKKSGFDVVSIASNHAMDYGEEPMLDTIELFKGWGMQVIGAGRDEQEARSPAILEKNGVRVAILAYCSVLRDGQAAGEAHPGIAPLRAHTFYEPDGFQPGTPPTIITTPVAADVEAMAADIARAREDADAVVLFIHWGIRLLPKINAQYQEVVAHAAIDAGADLILGHHPHCVKAVELYKGKVCFYSIGNFMTTGSRQVHSKPEWNLYWREQDPESLYNFPPHCNPTMIPKITVGKQGVTRVSFLPAYINKLAQPEVLQPGHPLFDTVLREVEWVSDYVPHSFRVEGDEVVVEA
jgi:poly-gamma-glutamate capsule biosynthesis protein CapA/YwtB (metallophosphatase superfamily)